MYTRDFFFLLFSIEFCVNAQTDEHAGRGSSIHCVLPDSWLRSGGGIGAPEYEWLHYRCGSLDAESQCDYVIELSSTSGAWKRDCVFDCVMVTPI